jgi:hypothetical protein
VLVVLGGGEHQHLGGGPVLFDLGQHADAVLAGQEQVQQHHAGGQGADRLEGAGAVGGLAEDLDAVLVFQ